MVGAATHDATLHPQPWNDTPASDNIKMSDRPRSTMTPLPILSGFAMLLLNERRFFCSRYPLVVARVVTTCLFALALTGCSKGSSEPESNPSSPPSVTADGQSDSATAPERLILGTWEDDYKGKRTLTVREDGTATMIVEPSGLNSLFAARLRFEETWSIAEGHLTMTVTGGEPAERVKLICQMMGDSTRQQILRLDQEWMHLQDPDGETTYEWRRVAAETRDD